MQRSTGRILANLDPALNQALRGVPPERFAAIVGRERVIAGADCGFAAFAGRGDIHPSIVWVKLAALAEGARRASARRWRQLRERACRP